MAESQPVHIERVHLITGGRLGKMQVIVMDSELKHVEGKCFVELKFGKHGKVLFHKLFTGVAKPMDRTDSQNDVFKMLVEKRVAASLTNDDTDTAKPYKARVTPYMKKKEIAKHRDMVQIDAVPKTVVIKIQAGENNPPFEMVCLSSTSKKESLCVEFNAANLGFIADMCKVSLHFACFAFSQLYAAAYHVAK